MIEVKKPVPHSQVAELQAQIEEQQAIISYLLRLANGEESTQNDEQE